MLIYLLRYGKVKNVLGHHLSQLRIFWQGIALNGRSHGNISILQRFQFDLINFGIVHLLFIHFHLHILIISQSTSLQLCIQMAQRGFDWVEGSAISSQIIHIINWWRASLVKTHSILLHLEISFKSLINCKLLTHIWNRSLTLSSCFRLRNLLCLPLRQRFGIVSGDLHR